ASSISSKVSRAGAKASASALPMPTAWLPCPGKMNARVMCCRLASGGRQSKSAGTPQQHHHNGGNNQESGQRIHARRVAAGRLFQPAHQRRPKEAAQIADRIDEGNAARRRRSAEERWRQGPIGDERRIDSNRGAGERENSPQVHAEERSS